MTDDLAARYGRPRTGPRRGRRLVVVIAIAVVAVIAAWVLWAGLGRSTGSLEATDTGYTVVDEHTVTVSFAVSVDPRTPVICAVQALDSTYGVIGWKVVSYPGSTRRLTPHTETLRTTERADTGLIYRCRLA